MNIDDALVIRNFDEAKEKITELCKELEIRRKSSVLAAKEIDRLKEQINNLAHNYIPQEGDMMVFRSGPNEVYRDIGRVVENSNSRLQLDYENNSGTWARLILERK
jgi:hypothetical protein